MAIGNPAFCLFLYWTGVHFQGELQHVGDGSEQKTKCWPIRTQGVGGVICIAKPSPSQDFWMNLNLLHHITIYYITNSWILHNISFFWRSWLWIVCHLFCNVLILFTAPVLFGCCCCCCLIYLKSVKYAIAQISKPVVTN